MLTGDVRSYCASDVHVFIKCYIISNFVYPNSGFNHGATKILKDTLVFDKLQLYINCCFASLHLPLKKIVDLPVINVTYC